MYIVLQSQFNILYYRRSTKPQQMINLLFFSTTITWPFCTCPPQTFRSFVAESLHFPWRTKRPRGAFSRSKASNTGGFIGACGNEDGGGLTRLKIRRHFHFLICTNYFKASPPINQRNHLQNADGFLSIRYSTVDCLSRNHKFLIHHFTFSR